MEDKQNPTPCADEIAEDLSAPIPQTQRGTIESAVQEAAAVAASEPASVVVAGPASEGASVPVPAPPALAPAPLAIHVHINIGGVDMKELSNDIAEAVRKVLSTKGGDCAPPLPGPSCQDHKVAGPAHGYGRREPTGSVVDEVAGPSHDSGRRKPTGSVDDVAGPSHGYGRREPTGPVDDVAGPSHGYGRRELCSSPVDDVAALSHGYGRREPNGSVDDVAGPSHGYGRRELPRSQEDEAAGPSHGYGKRGTASRQEDQLPGPSRSFGSPNPSQGALMRMAREPNPIIIRSDDSDEDFVPNPPPSKLRRCAPNLRSNPPPPAPAADGLCKVCGLRPPNAMLRCRHAFCEDCIVQWKRRQGTCPVCRAAFRNWTRIHV